MTLYRDNSKPYQPLPKRDTALPIVPPPDQPEPWSFRTRDDFPELLNRWGLTGVGVEVGCYRGGYANYILNHWPGILHCVDPWEYQSAHRDLLNTPDVADNEAIARNHLSGFVDAGRCAIHKGYSIDVAANFIPTIYKAHRPFDFVYVDALHDYASCLADMRAWAPLIKPGGVLSGHDYLDHPTGPDTITEFGVVSAVRDWCAENGYDVARDVLTTTQDGYPTWVIRLR